MHYWINVVSKDHLHRGIAGSFTQANHGKPWALRKMNKGDWIIFYSPKTNYEQGESLQAFTGLCQVIDDTPYQVEMTSSFHPWRRKVRFETVEEVLIKPLIAELAFIKDKTHWGYAFRFGVIEISKKDFELITTAIKHA